MNTTIFTFSVGAPTHISLQKFCLNPPVYRLIQINDFSSKITGELHLSKEDLESLIFQLKALVFDGPVL
jgi:hypothetical protein